jgi:PAS domain S-box-containing protein
VGNALERAERSLPLRVFPAISQCFPYSERDVSASYSLPCQEALLARADGSVDMEPLRRLIQGMHRCSIQNMPLSFNKLIGLGSLVLVLLMLVVGWESYHTLLQLNATTRQVTHTYQVLATLSEVHSHLQHAETSQRGYLITGDERYRSSWQQAAIASGDAIARLRSLTADDPAQQKQLDRLEPQIQARLALLGKTAAVYQAQGFERAREQIRINQSIVLMGQIDETLTTMEREEHRLLGVREAAAQASTRRATTVVVAGSLFAVLLVTLATLVVTRTIARRQQVERALREREETLQAIFTASPDIITVLDPAGRVRSSSSAIHTILGTPRSAQTGMLVPDLIDPRDRPQLVQRLEELVRGTREEAQVRYRYPHADGHWVVLEGRAHVMTNTAGENTGIVVVSRDVTAQAHLEADLQQAKEAADAANVAKSEFLSRMSHELRTPLNAILGFGQLLEQADLTSRQKRNVGLILKGGRHLLDLINEVLDISRIEAGRLQLSVEPVAVHHVIQEVLDLVQPLAAPRQIQVRALPGVDGCTHSVWADLQRLKQVVLNLLSNAIKYNREGGEVSVDCALVGAERLRLLIQDTGPGIAPDKLHRLFVPFDRLDAEQTRIEGTGLGLALSQRLIEAMNGTMGVDSTLDVGSTFWVELPLAEQVTQPHRRIPPPALWEADPLARSILYIEDNLSNLELIEQVLDTRPGLRLISALQGRLGLELARKHRPDVILLDVHLPDLSGAEVLAMLQADADLRSIPVIILSADATMGQIERLRRAGARAYLTKPLDVPEFLQTLDEVLRPSAEHAITGERTNPRPCPK